MAHDLIPVPSNSRWVGCLLLCLLGRGVMLLCDVSFLFHEVGCLCGSPGVCVGGGGGSGGGWGNTSHLTSRSHILPSDLTRIMLRCLRCRRCVALRCVACFFVCAVQ